jgi:hypothetical protein
MANAARNVVTAPLVITKKEDGSDLYLYHGAELPDHLSKEEVQRLTDLGFVEKVKDGDPVPEEPAAESN